MPNLKRRTLLTAAVAAPIALIAAARPHKNGGAHDAYFLNLQAALRKAGLYRPTLVIDREKLAQNIARLKQHLPKNKQYRIVAKSLPSMGLIREVRAATGTDRLMVFHQPHVNLVAQQMPDAQVLVGKPLPMGAAKHFYDLYRPGAFDPSKQVEWLVDTHVRLAEYRELARAGLKAGRGPMRINLEIDVGLHRGGFTTAQDVAEAIRVIEAEPALRWSGFMGYEAHVDKMPDFLGGPRKALDKAMAFYSECIDAAKSVQGERYDASKLTLNAGGSHTYEMYSEAEPCNELSMGSGLVKPIDFDTQALQDHIPASFIATPVLKALNKTDLPGLESLTPLFRAWDPNTARTFYTYGGYWLAQTVSPPGLQRNAIWGHSTNQEMLNGSTDVQLAAGDFVFMRPQQSEFVFLQFGDIAVYDKGAIVDYWPVFPETEHS